MITRKAAVLVVVVFIVGLALTGCGGAPVVKIGVIAEITGSMPAVGTSCRDAAALAAREINDSGGISIGGEKYTVELVIKDSAGKPETAAAMAKELVEDDDVVAIVGPNSTGNAVPAAGEAEKGGVVLVSPWSTGAETTLDDSGKPKKSVFRVCVTVSYEGEHLAGFARENLKAGTAAILFDDTAEVLKSQSEDFRDSYTASGGTVVAYEAFKPGNAGITSQLEAIKAAGAEVLFINAYYGEVPELLKQVKSAGITAQIVGSDAWSSPDIIDQAGSDIEGSYVFNMYSSESGNPDTREFVKAYEDEYGTTPDDIAALTYDAVGLVKRGLEGLKDTGRQSLADSMLGLREFKGVTGKMRFPEDSRDPLRGAVMLRVENGQFVLFAELHPKATKEDVVAFVEEAVEYAKANGKEKVLEEFSNPEGLFNRGELYIFAYDFNGVNIAHGGNKAFIGQNLIGMQDPEGVMVIQGLIEQAEQGSGWLEYMWENPLHNNKVEPKFGYVMKVDDTWWLGSGIYVE